MDTQSTHPDPVQCGGRLAEALAGVGAVSLGAGLQEVQLVSTAVVNTVSCCTQEGGEVVQIIYIHI